MSGLWKVVRATVSGLVLIVLIWMAAILFIPSCRTAGELANLLPENSYWPHERAVQTLFKMRPHSCIPKVTAGAMQPTVRRYCFDQEYAPPNWGGKYRASEDAIDIDLNVDPQGIDVESLILNLHPGAVTGPSPPYLGRLDINSDNDMKFETADHPSSNTADWWVTYTSPSFSGTRQIHFTYYALTSSTSSPSNSCKAGSKVTTLTWSVKEFGITLDREPVKFTTHVVDWLGLAGQDDATRRFAERRALADRIRKEDTANRQGNPNDYSGWKLWPAGVLDNPSGNQDSVRFAFCENPQTPCNFGKTKLQ